VLQTTVGSLKWADCDTVWLIGINVVTGGFLCAADSSCFLEWADCDYEWLIGINFVTGGVLCAADSSWFFKVS